MAASGMQAATLPVTNPLLLLVTDSSASVTAFVAHAPLATEARLEKAEEKLKEAKVELKEAKLELEKAEEKLKEAPDEEAKARAKMAIDSAQKGVTSAQELVSAFSHKVARLVGSPAGSCRGMACY